MKFCRMFRYKVYDQDGRVLEDNEVGFPDLDNAQTASRLARDVAEEHRQRLGGVRAEVERLPFDAFPIEYRPQEREIAVAASPLRTAIARRRIGRKPKGGGRLVKESDLPKIRKAAEALKAEVDRCLEDIERRMA